MEVRKLKVPLNFIDYKQISWNEIEEPKEYR